MEQKNLSDSCLWSVMFSPMLNSSLIAVAGANGTEILDIRYTSENKFCSTYVVFFI